MNAMARARTPRELQEAVNRLDEFRRIEDDRRELANLKFCVINSLGYERRLYFIRSISCGIHRASPREQRYVRDHSQG